MNRSEVRRGYAMKMEPKDFPGSIDNEVARFQDCRCGGKKVALESLQLGGKRYVPLFTGRLEVENHSKRPVYSSFSFHPLASPFQYTITPLFFLSKGCWAAMTGSPDNLRKSK